MKTLGQQRSYTAVIVLALVLSLLAPSGTAWAMSGGDQNETSGSGAGLSVASWLLTVPYGAAKCAFAILGGVFGAGAYAATGGDLDTAKKVWTTSMYGTYIITPEHLKGDKPVRFFGQATESAAPGTPAPAPAP
jgi:hypothetical protein